MPATPAPLPVPMLKQVMTAEWQKECQALLNELFKKDKSWGAYFAPAIQVNLLEGYALAIQQPTCLDAVKARLTDGSSKSKKKSKAAAAAPPAKQFTTVEEFLLELRRVFSNSVRYNQFEMDIKRDANSLRPWALEFLQHIEDSMLLKKLPHLKLVPEWQVSYAPVYF